MKISKYLPYVFLLLLLGVGMFLFLKGEEQQRLGNYVNFVKESSLDISNKINDQGDKINGISELEELTDEEIKNLRSEGEKISVLLETNITRQTEFDKPDSSEELVAAVEEFYKLAKESNQKYLSIVEEMENLEKEEVLLERIKEYNYQIAVLEEEFNKLVDELNLFVSETSRTSLI